VGGLVGFFQLPSAVHDATQWAAHRAKQSQNETNPSVVDQAAQWIHTVHQLPGVDWTTSYMAWFAAWEALFIAGAARKGILKRTLPPEDLWKALNSRGVTGKNLTVGVVDSGFLPTRTLPADRVTFYTPDDLEKQARPTDKGGHGTAVANLIARGAPDARFVVVAYATQDQERALEKNVSAFFKQGMKDPSTMTLQGLREIFKPLIENIANGVKHSVDAGANVVNVSLSVEQAVQMNLMIEKFSNLLALARRKYLSPPWVRNTPEHDKAIRTHQAFIRKLSEMSRANDESETINQAIKELYKPWLEALDYAHARGVPVVLASGNSGGHSARSGDLIGNINLLAAFKHPALMVVGSTDHTGTVSEFTSEMNQQVTPWIAGNGSGELTTETVPERSWFARLWFPLGGLRKKMQYENPPGTSFAAPDLTLLYLKMKGVNPDLTHTEAMEIIAETAQKAKFSEAYEAALREKIEAERFVAEVDKRLRNIASDRLFALRLYTHLVKELGDEQRARTLLRACQLEQQGHRVTLVYDEMLQATEKVYLLKAFQNTLMDYKEELLKLSPTPDEVEAALEAELKRRVGHGMVRRHDAVAEAERRAKVKSKPA
jgi:subtilisin family serine protease